MLVLEVAFRIVGASAVPFSASPQIAFRVEIRAGSVEDRVESILLRCTTRIEAGARAHDENERARLEEVLGGAGVWERSSRSLLWTQTTVVVPGFQGSTTVDVLLPCGYDLAVAASKYLHGVTHGDVPILAQFSGTIFHATSRGLSVSQIPWDREARFRMPLALWQHVVDEHFPDSAVLSLGRDVFERLDGYRREQGFVRWDDAVLGLLKLLGSPRDTPATTERSAS